MSPPSKLTQKWRYAFRVSFPRSHSRGTAVARSSRAAGVEYPSRQIRAVCARTVCVRHPERVLPFYPRRLGTIWVMSKNVDREMRDPDALYLLVLRVALHANSYPE